MCTRITYLLLRPSQEKQQLAAQLQPLRELARQEVGDFFHFALGLRAQRFFLRLRLSSSVFLLLLRYTLKFLLLGELEQEKGMTSAMSCGD